LGFVVVSAGAGHQDILKGLVMMRILFYKSRKKVKREAFLKSDRALHPEFQSQNSPNTAEVTQLTNVEYNSY
jgi:hypothetical protein